MTFESKFLSAIISHFSDRDGSDHLQDLALSVSDGAFINSNTNSAKVMFLRKLGNLSACTDTHYFLPF